ncbi:MAG TPA: hypothetical protein VFQ65_11365 [Kofleriaceae bacterium]|nr:hypothetical protein [Kofleriaceae bacterium]
MSRWLVIALLVACRGGDERAPAPQPTPPAEHARPRPIAIAVEDRSVLVLLDDGTLRGWGNGRNGLLGQPNGPDRATPAKLPSVGDATELVVVHHTACARTRAGAWWCWGGDRAPAVDPRLAGATSVVLGSNFGCALRSAGTVACWGYAPGHEASSVFESRLPPASPRPFAEVHELHDVTGLASSASHVCAVEADGSVWCWGSDSHGQVSGTALAFDQDRVVDKPTKVAGVGHAVDIGAAFERTCVHAGGSAWCWGTGHSGVEQRPALGPFVDGGGLEICERSGAGIQCGITEPVPARALASDVDTTCTIDNDVVRCAGDNSVGQLGDGTLASRKEPRPVVGLVEGHGAALPAPSDPAGARVPAWDSAPCKHDATLQFAVEGFSASPFVVRTAFARRASDWPNVAIDLSDHLVDLETVGRTPKPAGEQRTVQLLLVNYNAKVEPLALGRGRYPLRHPAPGKAGEVHVWGTHGYASNIDEKPGFTGSIELQVLSDRWVCGSIDASGPAGTIRGSFAAELVD